MQHFIDTEEHTHTKKPSKLYRKIRLLFFVIFIAPALILLFKNIGIFLSRRREEKKYKKIIKKGLFWDTEYLIERD